MKKTLRRRKLITSIVALFIAGFTIFFHEDFTSPQPSKINNTAQISSSVNDNLDSLEVKGRAPKTGYSRDQFGKGWQKQPGGCDTRNIILKRDLTNTTENSKCQVLTGTLDDPYTGKTIEFSRKDNASAVQIEHVVALSDAWQKGAQQLSAEERLRFANDDLNLLAVDGPANQQKGDADAATWLPSNKSFRCQYAERQIAVKKKYRIWVTQAEKSAFKSIIDQCSTN